MPGLIEAAPNASPKALASPFAAAYPEWRETREEIRLGEHRVARSVAAQKPAAANVHNLLLFPLEERRGRQPAVRLAPEPSLSRARILDYAEWKKKMVEEPDGTTPETSSSQPLTDREMILRLIQLVSARERTTEELEMMLAEVEKIATAQKDKSCL